MAKKNTEVADPQEQFEGTEFEGQAPNAPDAEEAAKEASDTRVWTNAAGEEVKKSEFIREQFTLNNMSRRDIADKFDIAYRTVYGATMNLVNDAEPSTRGRSSSSTKIVLTADNKVLGTSTVEVEGAEPVEVVTIDNVPQEVGVTAESFGETTTVDRNTWISDQVAGGRARAEVADALGLSYGVVYQLTKENTGSRQRHDVEYEGKTISRSEYIRILFGQGKDRAEIAKELGVDYSIVWSALKQLKSEDEKYTEAIDKVAKFEDLVADEYKEDFIKAIQVLRDTYLKQPEPVAEEVAENAEDTAQESVYTEE